MAISPSLNRLSSSASILSMSTFSLSALQVTEPSAESKLRGDWDDLCKKISTAIAEMPNDVRSEIAAQAKWLCSWEALMVSGSQLNLDSSRWGGC
jgi:hypothetical protein